MKLSRIVSLLLLCPVVACGGSDKQAKIRSRATVVSSKPGLSVDTYREAPVTLSEELEVVEGASLATQSCTRVSVESCNGRDDDCDGEIDESCGVPMGSVQVVAYWEDGVDIDLFVTGPKGETVSHHHRKTATGGMFAQEGRGLCARDLAKMTRRREPSSEVSATQQEGKEQTNSIESIFWRPATPPLGIYRVSAHYWGECGSAAGPTEVTIGFSVGLRMSRSLTVTLTPNLRTRIANFRVKRKNL